MQLGENEDIALWEKNVRDAIRDLADIELQKMTWSGRHPEYISSFTETLARLYDDLDFREYIEYHRSMEGETNSNKRLSELHELLQEYKDFGYATEEQEGGYNIILADSRWIEITEKAKAYLSETGIPPCTI